MTNDASESPLRVLLLDDDQLDVKLMQDKLRASINCRVTVLDSMHALLASLWKELPDVVISDMNIPGFSGLMALEMMKKLHPDIPFVICSGNDSPETRAKALAAGANACVPKTEIHRLVAVVNQVCG